MSNKKDAEDGVWRTVGGRRIFIRNGVDLATAMRESGKFKINTEYKVMSDDEIKDFQATSDMCYNTLEQNEKEAMYEYTMGGHRDVNDYLNGKFDGYEFTQEMIDKIDNAVSKYKLDDDIVAYRGTCAAFYSNYGVGDNFREDMFYSTSLKKEIAETFANDNKSPYMLQIRIPMGTRCIYIGENTDYDFEAELLLSRGLTYKVIGKSDNDMILEVINEKRK